ncbi:MAG: AMP-binding protein, partial [Acidimicrobiales bacterium]
MAGTELLVGEVFRRAAEVTPDAVAASLGTSALRFGGLDRASDRAATALGGLGAGRGERVAWCGPTSLDAVVLFAAAAKLGAVLVPLNPGLSPEELSALLDKARCRLLVWGGATSSTAREAAAAAALDTVETGSLLRGGAGAGGDPYP